MSKQLFLDAIRYVDRLCALSPKSLGEQADLYTVLNQIKNKADHKAQELRLELLSAGHPRIQGDFGVIKCASSRTNEFNEKKLLSVLNSCGINPEEVYEAVQVTRVSPSKIQTLIERGLVPEEAINDARNTRESIRAVPLEEQEKPRQIKAPVIF